MTFRELFLPTAARKAVLAANAVLLLGTICTLLAIGYTASHFSTPYTIPTLAETVVRKSTTLSSEAISGLDCSLLRLRNDGGQYLLQEVERSLRYHGYNGRPDTSSQSILSFSFGTEEPFSVVERKPLYVEWRLGEDGQPNGFILSKQDKGVRFVAYRENDRASVELSLAEANLSDDGKQLVRRYPLSPCEPTPWLLEGAPVNMGTLLRQRCRWIGRDHFLERHGGKEYAAWTGRESLLFGSGPATYRCYLGVGESLVWKEGRWHQLESAEEGVGSPLMQLRKVESERLLVSLWDCAGVAPVELMIDLSHMGESPDHIICQLNIQGIKTMQQAIVQIGEERMVLECGDWFLYQGSGWSKLETEEQLEGYVEGTVNGHLLVVDEISVEEGRHFLRGHLFNTYRSEEKEVRLELQQGNDSFSPIIPRATYDFYGTFSLSTDRRCA